MMDQIALDCPRAPEEKQHSYLLAKSPECRKIFKGLLEDGYSRSGAMAKIEGAMRVLAEDLS
jgi:hypothetical protein